MQSIIQSKGINLDGRVPGEWELVYASNGTVSEQGGGGAGVATGYGWGLHACFHHNVRDQAENLAVILNDSPHYFTWNPAWNCLLV